MFAFKSSLIKVIWLLKSKFDEELRQNSKMCTRTRVNICRPVKILAKSFRNRSDLLDCRPSIKVRIGNPITEQYTDVRRYLVS